MYAAYCKDCYEFLELNKWNPVPQLFQSRHGSGGSAYVNFDLSAAVLLDATRTDTDAAAFPELRECLRTYVTSHSHHQLGMSKSGGDWPWWPDEEGWFVWKRVAGPFYHPLLNSGEVDLPRNIIEDLGIKEWPDALAHYRLNCPSVDSPEALKPVFMGFIVG